MIIRLFTTQLDQNLIVKIIKINTKKQQNIGSIPLIVSNYLKKFKPRSKRFERWNRRCKQWHWLQ